MIIVALVNDSVEITRISLPPLSDYESAACSGSFNGTLLSNFLQFILYPVTSLFLSVCKYSS